MLVTILSFINAILFSITLCIVYIMELFGLGMTFGIFGFILSYSLIYPENFINIIENTKTFIQNMHKNEGDNGIVFSPCGQYYTYKEIHYDIAFPVFYLFNEKPGTGPHHCLNCRDYGSLRGVFIMYCMNCAQEYENNEAGYGATINNGVEKGGDDIHKSAWFSYLKYRDPSYIGLPEELEQMDFHRPGYKYIKTYDVDDNGNIIHFYPAFVETESETDIDFVDDVNDIQSETGSETTEVLW